MKTGLSAAGNRVKDFEAASRLVDELVADIDHALSSRRLERYSDEEKIRYGLEEKTTMDGLMVAQSYLIEAKSRFPATREGLLEASDL